jgi:hypothetical protein
MDKLSWNTEFITADNLMIHTFSDRVKVVSNIQTGEIRIFRDNEVIGRRNDMPISEYERFLLTIAKDATKLQGFTDYGRLE